MSLFLSCCQGKSRHMPLIRTETFVATSPERCFDLARDVGVHTISTSRTRERAVAGKTSGLLELGDEVTWEAVHFGVKQRLTARITRFDRPRSFRDQMVHGASTRFTHRHVFEPWDRDDRPVRLHRAPRGAWLGG